MRAIGMTQARLLNRGHQPLAVRFPPMQDASYLKRISRNVHEEDPVVSDAQPKFLHSLERLYVPFTHIRETMQ